MRAACRLCLLALLRVCTATAGPATAGSVDLEAFGGRVRKCVADCACPPGSTGAACVRCAAGFFKAAHGPAECRPCPANSSSPAGAASARECLCAPGRLRDGAGCAPCPSDFYKAAHGDAGCTACPHGAYAPAGTAGVEGCVCGAGFTANGPIACVQCAAGTFKAAPGPAACEACPADTYSAVLRLADPAGCTHCQANSSTGTQTGRTESSACECDAGFYMSSNACTLCTQNYYCPGGHLIYKCTEHAHGAAGLSAAAACVCDDGYYRSGATCTACPANSFCAADERTACPNDSAAPGGSSTVDACVCVGGFERV